MNGIPNVDVVVVTRCKDCKHSALPSELTQRYGKPGTLTCHNRYAPCNRRNVSGDDFLQLRQAEGGRRMRFLVTLALDAPDDADPQGIKEKVAMDFEKYGGVHVVKVERVEEYQQMTMGTTK